MSNIQTLTVSELVQGIRQLIEGVPAWQRVWVVGELSAVKRHSSGHWYFLLKDASAQLRAVMFRRDAESLKEPLQDGMAVMAFGRVGVFERDGQTQFYVQLIRPVGLGAQEAALQQLKERLWQEGLFSRPKRPIPRLPRAVGVITSDSGAARYDIETVIRRRYPGMPILLHPVRVQGTDAVRDICAAVERMQHQPIDVLIIGRGGGSREDLMTFNQEAVVRAVFQSRVPVISAVGHEIDTTLVDLVADLRAPTPSAAAELAVPVKAQLAEWHRQLSARAFEALRGRLEWERRRLRGWTDHGVLTRPDAMIREYRYRLERLDERAQRQIDHRLSEARHAWEKWATKVTLLDPRAPLSRGYAYVTDEAGELVTRQGVQWNQRYQIHWSDGDLWIRPTESEAKTNGNG